MYSCIGWTQMQQATRLGVGTEQASSVRTSSVIDKKTVLQNFIYFLKKGHFIVCHIFTISPWLLSDNTPVHHRYYLLII